MESSEGENIKESNPPLECSAPESKSIVDNDTIDADDPYHYTKRGEFTSELYKICVDNLPYYVGYQVSVKRIFLCF